jgi:hypothetical protein
MGDEDVRHQRSKQGNGVGISASTSIFTAFLLSQATEKNTAV